jgi:hypothetical protein
VIKTKSVLTGKRCQCPSCKEYFSTTANFDRHRRGIHGVDRACVDPIDAGLVVRQSGSNSFWSMPEPPIPAEIKGRVQAEWFWKGVLAMKEQEETK